MTELDKAIQKFDDDVVDRVFVNSKYQNIIAEAQTLIQSLQKGPAGGEGYLAWPGDLLQEAEFNLARMAEYLAMEEGKADARSSFAKDKFKQIFARTAGEVRKEFSLQKPKFTASEVEDETRSRLVAMEDSVNLYYAEFRTLKNLVESIQRIMLCLTHRINELQAEKRYRS